MLEFQLLERYATQLQKSNSATELTSHQADRRAAYARANKAVTYSQAPSNQWLAPIVVTASIFALPILAILSLQS